MRDISLIVPNPKNSNKHSDKQIKLLAKLIEHHGWRHPIIISKRSGFVCAGHGRLESAKLNGYEKVPVDMQDFENEASEILFLESDNHIAELAEHDKNAMIDNLKSLDLGDDFDLELTGIPDFSFEIAESEIKDKNTIIDEEKFLIVIECKNELEQRDLFGEFETREIECKLMS